MILSDCVKIEYVNNLSVEYIEGELQKKGITPIRWAITDKDEKFITISLAYERE